MQIIKIETDTLRFEVTTHVEYGNMHIKIENPFEKSISEIISPEDTRKLISALQQALEINNKEEE